MPINLLNYLTVPNSISRQLSSVVVRALACHLEVIISILNWCKFLKDLIKTLRSTQPQLGTRIIWEVKAACMCHANDITTYVSS
jgi:hypothetical protein